jgi:hypothetical protein
MTKNNSATQNKDVLLLALFLFLLIFISKFGERLWYMWAYPPISSLMIDETPFPQGWAAGEIDTDFPPLAPCSTGREEIGDATRGFYFDSPSYYVGGVFIRLQRFKNPSTTANYYRRAVSHEFRDTEWNTPWFIPDEINFTSQTADQYKYSCSLEVTPNLAKPVCIFIAQYEVHLIEVYVDFYDTTSFTYKDIIPIFDAIDQKMSY